MARGSSPRRATSTISCCQIFIFTPAWFMPCCARAAWKSAKAIFSAQSNDRQRLTRPCRAWAPAVWRFAWPLRQLLHQPFDAAEQCFLGARHVPKSQLERAIETVFLGVALNELQHALRIDLILLLEQDVTAAGAGV